MSSFRFFGIEIQIALAQPTSTSCLRPSIVYLTIGRGAPANEPSRASSFLQPGYDSSVSCLSASGYHQQHGAIAPAANVVDVPACIMVYSLRSTEHRRFESRSGKPRIVREENRIRFLLQRDGPAAATAWVRRTMHIYRAAVLDKNHFASSNGFRRGFIEAYCDFKRWLAAAQAHEKFHDSA